MMTRVNPSCYITGVIFSPAARSYRFRCSHLTYVKLFPAKRRLANLSGGQLRQSRGNSALLPTDTFSGAPIIAHF